MLGQRWDTYQKIWQIVEKDSELRVARENWLNYLEVERKENLRALAEWREFLQEQAKIWNKTEKKKE
jgi:hypothetical protein